MSIETVTLYLDPSDATISEYFDSSINGTMYTFTIEKTKIPFLAKFILDKLSQKDKEAIPPHIKTEIIKGAGLKYVYRVPSILRTLGVGISIGIALKTLSDGQSKDLLGKLPSLANKALSWISSYPCASAVTLAGASLATTLVSQELASTVSCVIEGTLSVVKKTIAIAGKTIWGVKTFCVNHPIKTSALGALAMGCVAWNKTHFQAYRIWEYRPLKALSDLGIL